MHALLCVLMQVFRLGSNFAKYTIKVTVDIYFRSTANEYLPLLSKNKIDWRYNWIKDV